MVLLLMGGCAWKSKLDQAERQLESKQQVISQQRGRIQQLNGKVDQLIRRNNKLRDGIASLRNERNRLQNQNKRLQSKIKSLNNERNNLQKQLQTQYGRLREEIRTLDQQMRHLQSRSDSISQQITALERQKSKWLEKLTRENKQLQQDLSNIQQTSARRDGNNVVITLQARLLFDLGKAALRSEAQSTLDEIATVLSRHPERKIVVEGHADTQPIRTPSRNFFGVKPSNWHLSAARSVSVIEYLVTQHPLNPKRFVAAGYGDLHPRVPNNSPENRQKNRRVEIVLFPPNLEQQPLMKN